MGLGRVSIVRTFLPRSKIVCYFVREETKDVDVVADGRNSTGTSWRFSSLRSRAQYPRQAVTVTDTNRIECHDCGDPATGMARDLSGQSHFVCKECGHSIFFDYSDLPDDDPSPLSD